MASTNKNNIIHVLKNNGGRKSNSDNNDNNRPEEICSFVEIVRPSSSDDDADPPKTFIEAYCLHVEPKQCSKVVKELSKTLPLESNLAHLKRVRKMPTTTNTNTVDQQSPSSTPEQQQEKRPKLMPLLQILIGTSLVDNENHPIIQEYKSTIHSIMVPKNSPQSEEEYKDCNRIWPTHYYPLKTQEYLKTQLALSTQEMKQMKDYIERSVSQKIVFIVDPISNTVVSTSEKEHNLQKQSQKEQQRQPSINPLATPILYSIQGVSRQERKRMMLQADRDQTIGKNHNKRDDDGDGADDDDDTTTAADATKGQYLCTGYDVYCYREPTIFEAMACLHSRVRQLIYYYHNSGDGRGGNNNNNNNNNNDETTRLCYPNGCSKHYIHDLPGTNHHYRVFEYHNSSSTC
jgi:tRNA-specific adenosine deaminase 3